MASDKVRLVLTCGACPEQYDAYVGDELVGYLRLRHGYFSVRCPDPSGYEVYSAHPRGDGIFESGERETYLRFGVQAILEHRRRKQELPEPNYEIESGSW